MGRPCEKGTFSKSGECVQCSIGQYTDQVDQSNCKDCGIGKFNNLQGQSDESVACKNCGTGKFNDLQGQSNCKNCWTGQFNDLEGLSACKNCVTGQFNDLEGLSACKNCGTGQFNDLEGVSACKNCVRGKFNDLKGQSNCKNCGTGQFNDLEGQSNCQNCTAGKFNVNMGQDSCVLCHAGKFSNLEGQSDCKNCAIGKFNKFSGQWNESIACKNCGLGKFNDLNGQSDCKDCVSGKFNHLEGQSDCKNCTIGKFNKFSGQWNESIACKNCGLGKFNDLNGQSDCKDCVSGKFNHLEGQSDCKNCTIGKFNKFSGQPDCKNCSVGEFNNLEGQRFCHSCAVGKYSDVEGQNNCKLCGLGKFNNAKGHTCKLCDKGKFNNLQGQTACALCEKGKFNNLKGQATCTLCDKGKFNTLNGQVARVACMLCATGNFNNLEGQTSCKKCNKGTFNDLLGQPYCKHCGKGRYSNLEGRVHGKVCKGCPGGKYGNITGATSQDDACPFLCPPGKYGNIANATNINDACPGSIDVCPRGRFGKAISGATELRTGCQYTCPVGKYGRTVTALTFSEEEACFACIIPSRCLGEMNCKTGYIGEGCVYCDIGYYLVDGLCNKCPSSGFGLWVLAIIVVFVTLFTLNVVMKMEIDDLEESRSGSSDIHEFRRAPKSLFHILGKHFFALSISFPIIELVYIHPDLRHFIRTVISIFTIDVSKLITSPDCEWDLKFHLKYFVKGTVPMVFVGILCGWYSYAKLQLFDEIEIRKLKNRVIAIFFYVWIFSMYTISMLHALLVFACTNNPTGDSAIDTAVLRADINIVCEWKNNYWQFLSILAIISIVIYGTFSMLYVGMNIFSLKGVPDWIDAHNCPNYENSKSCQNCVACDKRTRFGFLFSKYRTEYYWFELVVLLYKLFSAVIVLFLGENSHEALVWMLILNIVFAVITCIAQPYLSDEEDDHVRKLGREHAQQSVHRKSCSKKGCNKDNIMDVGVTFGLSFILGSELIFDKNIAESFQIIGLLIFVIAFAVFTKDFALWLKYKRYKIATYLMFTSAIVNNVMNEKKSKVNVVPVTTTHNLRVQEAVRILKTKGFGEKKISPKQEEALEAIFAKQGYSKDEMELVFVEINKSAEKKERARKAWE
eukprot:g3001.t1